MEGAGVHRTQIMLEEDQYVLLREQARREGKSLGELVRGLVVLGMASSAKTMRRGASLRSLKGMFRKPGVKGSDHDLHLYGAENR